MNIQFVKKKLITHHPKYSVFSCVHFTYRLLWQSERKLVWTGLVTIPISLILSALTLYIPPLIISTLETAKHFSTIFLIIIGVLGVRLLFEIIQNIITTTTEYAQHRMSNQMMYLWQKKRRNRDWYHEYDPEVQQKDERSKNAFQSPGSAGTGFPMDFANIIAAILNFLLFGSVISLLNPIIILFLAIGCYINYIAEHWKRKQNLSDLDTRNALEKELNYSTRDMSIHFQFAKDMRVYNMEEPLLKRLVQVFDRNLAAVAKVERRSFITAFINLLIILIRDSAAYGLLIYKAMQGEIDAPTFLLVFSAITSMSTLMDQILQILNRILEGAIQVSDFRETFDLPDKLNHGKGLPVPNSAFSIEFKNVSYQYPKGEKKILDHISFRIEAGEKIALVGLNGAGKTTLTMLMCGLLLPDEGEILLDGHSLYEYNRDEMYRLFGLVPQNFNLLPISIARNIAAEENEEEIDYNKLQDCIEIAGLSDKLQSLPNGVHTLYNRIIHKDAVDFSGGELQKLLLARLLYKNPPCMILDEPTAALDPIAEDRIYQNYHKFTANATAVFISHRLASTRFCDRIFLLEGAHFAEAGTHDELMAAGGKYKELFDIQSKYYKEEATEQWNPNLIL